VFADEPTGNLDSQASAEVLGFLRRSVDDFHQTVVMVTHDPIAAAYTDRVVFLGDGRVVDELRDPSADDVLEQMKKLSPRVESAPRES
jgi:putative ABC transport system ATP-binding protein